MGVGTYNPNFPGTGNSTVVTAVTPTTGTATLNALAGSLYTLTPTGTLTINSVSAPAGAEVTLVITTSGVTSYTITFGTGFKTVGTLATGTTTAKVFTIQFIGDGTNMNEVGRTTAM